MSGNKAVTINFLRLNLSENFDIPLPKYMTCNCAGMDIYAANKQDIVLAPKSVELIPTGFAIELPDGFEAQIRPRSGLAINNLIGILNSPGTIDADYRGEVKIILMNFGDSSFTLSRGDRIAQMVISKVYRANFNVVDYLKSTKRSGGGFGHTGI